MAEIYQYLNENDQVEPKVVLMKLRNYFGLNEVQAIHIYKIWRKQYLKRQTKVNPLRYKV